MPSGPLPAAVPRGRAPVVGNQAAQRLARTDRSAGPPVVTADARGSTPEIQRALCVTTKNVNWAGEVKWAMASEGGMRGVVLVGDAITGPPRDWLGTDALARGAAGIADLAPRAASFDATVVGLVARTREILEAIYLSDLAKPAAARAGKSLQEVDWAAFEANVKVEINNGRIDLMFMMKKGTFKAQVKGLKAEQGANAADRRDEARPGSSTRRGISTAPGGCSISHTKISAWAGSPRSSPSRWLTVR